jgi:glutamate--cysteine ligase
MTAETFAPIPTVDPIGDSRDPVDAARAHIAARALRATGPGGVGLELEFHLVDRTSPGERPDWATVTRLLDAVPLLPSRSQVSVEPGGQVELSTPVSADAATAIEALRADVAALRATCAAEGLGLVALGTDPARRPERINPKPRYVAMERHFAAAGTRASGRAMMCSTAALQVNLDAGPASGWAARFALAQALAPVLTAISSTSSHLAGRSSGWHSMRDEAWRGIDRNRSGRIAGGAPDLAWADHALDASLMLVAHEGQVMPVTQRVTLGEWLADPARIGWHAGESDVELHLTTLFPPVRPRGYLELRATDAMPDRWWPGLVAFVVTLLDDPRAADAASEILEPVSGLGEQAARTGLEDPRLATAAGRLLAVADDACPPGLRADLAALGVHLEAGRTPGQSLRERIDHVGPLRVLEEEADA